MAKDETPQTADGTVIASLANDLYKIELDSGHKVTAHVAGSARMRIVRVLPGDRVGVELSEFDHSRGRIVRRYE